MTLHYSSLANILIALNETATRKVIIKEGGKAVTVGEIYEDAIKIACGLQKEGFRTGDRVAIAAPANAEFIKMMYALIFLKGVVAIIDPEMGRDHYGSKLRQFNPQWAFVDSRLLLLQEHPVLRYFYLKRSKSAPYFPYTPTAKIIACGRRAPILQKKWFLTNWLGKSFTGAIEWVKEEGITNGGEKHTSPYRGDEFLVTYTSGTISEPKGVVHTFDSLFNSLQLIGDQLDRDLENLIATYLPHYMMIGFCVNLPSIVYHPGLSAAEKIAFFETHKVTIIMGPPSDFLSMIAHCEKTGSLFPPAMRHILLGSAPVTRRFLGRLSNVLPKDTRLTCLYGMTENLLAATVDGRFKKDYDCEGDLLGKPARGVTIKIVDDEIYIQSNQLYKRYFHLETRDAFHATGDLGAIDENGFLVLRGRKKDMIIRRNLNIYPAIYEATINRMEGVTEAVLVGVYEDSLNDEKVYLVVEGEGLNKEIILQHLKTGDYSIDREALPDEILLMNLPRSGRQHKVNKEAIRNFIKENQL